MDFKSEAKFYTLTALIEDFFDNEKAFEEIRAVIVLVDNKNQAAIIARGIDEMDMIFAAYHILKAALTRQPDNIWEGGGRNGI